MSKIGRNDPCPCGSGKKFKHCCALVSPAQHPSVNGFRPLVERALSLHAQGHLTAAEPLYRQAVQMRPRDAALLGLYGMLLHQSGQHARGVEHVLRALEIDPKDSRLHNYLGQMLVRDLQYPAAEGAFRRAVELDGRNAEAWANLGKAVLKQFRAEEALAHLRHALVLMPEDAGVLLDMALAQLHLGHMGSARDLLIRVRGQGEMTARADAWLEMLRQVQDPTAINSQDESKSERPDSPLALTCMDIGRVLMQLGRHALAESWFERARALGHDRNEVAVEIIQARKIRPEDRSWIDALASASDTGDPLHDRAREFALGKAYDDLGQYDLAFGYVEHANQRVRAQVPYDPAAYAAYIDRLISLFDATSWASMDAGSRSDLPVFIVGMPRSGTTLVEQIVSAHPDIAGAGELVYWGRAAQRVIQGLPRQWNAALASRLAEDYLAVLGGVNGQALRITDKMPDNYHYLGLIHAVFPRARIVHCRRHPLDTCLSIFFQNFTFEHAYKWDLDSLASHYHQYERLMAHWRQVLPPGTLHEVRYEDLVGDPEGESRRLMTFLDLDWRSEQLEFHQQERHIYTASQWQARQPVYKSSKERWRRYEKHLAPLLSLLKYAP